MGRLAADGSQVVSLSDGNGGVFDLPDLALDHSEAFIGHVGGRISVCSGWFTRVADTNVYASGDLIAQSTTATLCMPTPVIIGRHGAKPENGGAGTGMIRRLRIRKSGTSITTASVRAHLYSQPNIIHANGDNGSWSTNLVQFYIGSFDVTFDKAFTDGASGTGTPTVGSEINTVSPTVYVVLEARSAYTPSSAELFVYDFEVLQN